MVLTKLSNANKSRQSLKARVYILTKALTMNYAVFHSFLVVEQSHARERHNHISIVASLDN